MVVADAGYPAEDGNVEYTVAGKGFGAGVSAVIFGVEVVSLSVGFAVNGLDCEFEVVVWVVEEGAVDEVRGEGCEESEDDGAGYF